MQRKKKYGGVIERWYKVYLSDFGYSEEDLVSVYGPNLGYIVCGHLPNDPTDRGFGGHPLKTSLVVKFSPTQIETLNTVYDLGEPRVPD